jgi:hypothetical protein
MSEYIRYTYWGDNSICCNECGVMIYVNARSQHDDWHDKVDNLEYKLRILWER